jgi:hypothetical protein
MADTPPRKPRRLWAPEKKLRAALEAHLTYDQVAAFNERSTGWRPSKQAVSDKARELGYPPRRTQGAHRDLLPWPDIKPEHKSNILRYMLEAESRRRAGEAQSPKDKILTDLLHVSLFNRGPLWVVSYNPIVGFHTLIREPSDGNDIIRRPVLPDQG